MTILYIYNWCMTPSRMSLEYQSLLLSIQKMPTTQGPTFFTLQYFATKLCNFTKFRMLFQAVLIKFLISNCFEIWSKKLKAFCTVYLTMALNNACNSSLAFQRIDILRIISQQFIVLFQVMDKSVTQGRFEFSRINFLSNQVEQNVS